MRLVAYCGALWLLGITCSDATGPRSPTFLHAISAASQQAIVGTPVDDPPGVIVRDQDNQPVQGVTVEFSVVGGGGTVEPATRITGSDGTARVTRWTLGVATGNNTLTASAAGLPAVSFLATGVPAAAMATSLEAASPENQDGTVGTAVSEPPAVRVRRANGSPLPGVAVSFVVTEGNGTVSPTDPVTDNDGIARLASWTLGSAGVNVVTASVAALAPIAFSANAVSPLVATAIEAVTPQEQQSAAAAPVPTPPTVVVRDQHNNPLPGVTVSFAVVSGGGSVTPTSVVTNAGGIAAVATWTLGPVPGPNSLTATAGGLPPVLFQAMGLAPSVATSVEPVSGLSQDGIAGAAAPDPPTVLVRDQHSNPMAGVTVAFAVASGGGSVIPAAAETDAQGIAAVTSWVLGGTAGSNTLTATVAGIAPVTFSATAHAPQGVPATVDPATDLDQEGIAGQPVPTPPGVIVRDGQGAPLAGVSVTFSVQAGGGTVSPAVVVTSAAGIAAVASWTLGAVPGPNSLNAVVGGLPPVTFTATGAAPQSGPTTMQPVAGSSQQGLVGVPVEVPPAVSVLDVAKLPVPGVTVTFSVLEGGGSVTPSAAVTDQQGTARLDSWTLGPAAGTNRVRATAQALSPVEFTAIGRAPTSIEPTTEVSQEAPVNSPVPEAPGVLVRDQSGAPLAGVTVTFTVSLGGGSVSPASRVTGADGTAQLDSWILGAGPGLNTVSAAVTGLAPVTFAGNGVSGPTVPGSMEALTPTSQEAPVGAPVASPPAVIVRDQHGDPVAGVSVTFSVSAGGGSVSPAAVVTGPDGVAATNSWTLGPAAGQNTVTAAASGLAPVLFNATALPPASVVAITPTSQQALAGTAVATPPGVSVRDQNNSPVPNVAVTFTVTGGGGSAVPAMVNTNAQGEAHLTGWTLGAAPGNNTLSAAVAGLPGVNFSAIGVAPPTVQPASVEPVSTASQVAPAGAAVTDPPGVIVRDQSNSPLAGVTVAFTVTAGGGSVAPAAVVTDPDGIARLTSWTLGGGPGLNSVTASVEGLQPVTFSATGVLAPTSVVATTATDQQTPVATAVAAAPAVLVRDQNNDPMQGVTVAFAVTAGGGAVSPAMRMTNASGVAQVTSWTVGGAAGPNTMTATVTGLPAVVFAAQGYVPQATSMTAMPGMPTDQSAPGNMAVPHPPGALVLDQHGAPVAGVNVSFAVTAGTGAVTPSAVMTDASGIAQVTSWVLGNTGPAAQSVTATSGGLPSVVFNATRSSQALFPNSVAATTNTNQEAPAGANVPEPPGVLVRDQNNSPMQGVSVAFAVSAGGGSIAPASETTGADGIARLTRWTLGTAPGVNTVTATVGSLAPVTFNASGILVPASIQAATPTTQQAPAGSTVAAPPAVRIRDQNNNPLQGVIVAFAVTAGSGSIVPANVTTGADGIAQLTSWTLGAAPGTNTVTASVPGLPAVAFNATGNLVATSAQAASVTAQESPAGTPVVAPPAVIVRDQNNNPMQGVSVAFAVTAGGGTISPATVATGADGIARLTSWTLGSQAGLNTVTGTVAGLPSVVFNATGTLVATSVQASTTTNQQALVGTAVPTSPAVIVRDQNNNPMQGVNVAFAVTAGGGSVAPASVSTGANGVAQVTSWTLGPAGGVNTLSATVAGLPPASFNATGLAPSSIQAVTATTQSAPAGGTVSTPPGVIVRDQNSSPLAGVSVSFAVTAGGGAVQPAAVVTGADGIARLTSWTLGNTPGTNTVTATAAGLTPVAFSATGILVASSIAATTSTNQQALVGTAVAQPPAVVVRDQFNGVMQGVSVNFAVIAGGGAVSPATVITGQNGVAQVTVWTLGPAAGNNTLRATVADLTPVNFSATGLAPTSIQATTVTNQQAPAGGAVASPPGVMVRDQFNNPLPGVSVDFLVTAGGGFLAPASATTGGDGIARSLSWTLGSAPGVNTATAAVPALAPVTFNATGVLVPTLVQAATSVNQQAPVSGAVGQPPGVIVRDQFNNPMSGVNVAFAVTSGGGSISPSSVNTGAGGTAQLTSWTLGPNVGANTVSATVSGLAPVTFLANGILVPSSVASTTTTNQQAPAGSAVSTPPAVIVRAQNNTPLPNVAVTFVVTSGGGSVSPAVRMTGADGVAQLTSWTLGSVAGTNTVSATVNGLTPVTFTATGTLAATVVLANTATSQVGTVGAPVAIPPGVVVRDQNNNPIQAVNVAFAITGGGGSRAPASVNTNAQGVATLTSWTLGPSPGTNTLTATVAGFPPVTFTATGVGPSSLTAVTTTSQSARVGTAVATPPGVRVRDQNNNPLVGISVSFSVTAGAGSISPPSVLTGADGIARLTTWTLGPNAGTNTVRATVSGLPQVNFNATGLAPTSVQAFSAESQNQEAPAGSAVESAPSVVVRDQNSNPLPGVNVTFAVTGGGGTLATTVATTGSSGFASASSWILGPNPGPNSVSATVSGLPAVTFSATGLPPSTAPASIQAMTATSQQATAGTTVLEPPGVRVLNAAGEPVSGATVSFAITAGGGIGGPLLVVTDAQGLAAMLGWRLGTTPGTNTVTATVSGLPPVTFTATGTGSGPVATSMQILTLANQQAAAGSAVGSPPGVLVRDQNGNAMPGVNVSFTVTAGGGSVTPGVVPTNSSGVAVATSWTLGSSGGQNTVSATVPGVPAITFTATGTLVPGSIEAVSATTQQGGAAMAVSQPPRVRVRDQNGNPLPGATVTVTVTAGGGAVSPGVQTTAADGTAQVAWTLGVTPGTNTISAAATGTAPVTFTATGVLVPASILAATAVSQQAPARATVADPPGVIVRNQLNQPMAGVNVSFAVTGGGGSVSPAARTTGADGIARLSSWTLGSVAGTQTVTATVTGLPAVTFTAHAILVPTVAQTVTATAQQLAAGADVADPPGVLVRDQNNNPLPLVNVAFQVTSGGGSVTPSGRLTGADGIARLSRWTVGVTPGLNTVIATPAGLPGLTFTATGFAPASLHATSATSQQAPVLAAVPQPPRVLVRDQNGNPLYGATVTFAVTAGGGTIMPAVLVTGADGIAQLSLWAMGASPGTNTVTATVSGLNPVVFSATALQATCPAPAPIAMGTTVSGNLGVTGCKLASGEFAEFYTFSVTQQTAVRATQSSTAFDSYVMLLRSTGKPVAENDDIEFGVHNSELFAFVQPGTYILAATSFLVGETGSFNLRVETTSSDVTECREYFVMRGLNTQQTISNADCIFTGQRRMDLYMLYLDAGETATIRMNSTAVTPYLVLQGSGGQVIEASGATSAQITYTAPLPGYYVFAATTASNNQLGLYTLTIQ